MQGGSLDSYLDKSCLQRIEGWNFRRISNRNHIWAKAYQVSIFFMEFNMDIMRTLRQDPEDSWEVGEARKDGPRYVTEF